MASLLLLFGVVLTLTQFSSLQASSAVVYPHDCQWVGLDQNHGPFIPVGVCKSIHRPQYSDGSTNRYSQKFVCAEDGSTVYSHVWQNNSYCDGEPDGINPGKASSFSCDGGICPYAIVRFYNQIPAEPNSTESLDPDYCMQDSSLWAEALMTTYQCLNISDEWYSLSCSADGETMISSGYTKNCESKIDYGIFNEGCEYKDKWIDIMHCDYYDDGSNDSLSTTDAAAVETTMENTENDVSSTAGQSQLDSTFPFESTQMTEFIHSSMMSSWNTIFVVEGTGSTLMFVDPFIEKTEVDSIWMIVMAFGSLIGFFGVIALFCCLLYSKKRREIVFVTLAETENCQETKRTNEMLYIEGDGKDFMENNKLDYARISEKENSKSEGNDVATITVNESDNNNEDFDVILLDEGDNITFK